METLLPKIVPKVSQYLTPQDLAHCCAVSPQWRKIFDQDWLWKPHCDVHLEELLRTTPPVVKPMFVSPEVDNSSLTTISKWRLAFLREQHLCGNWKKMNWKTHPFESDDILLRSFLSNNLFLNWTDSSIQILDVSLFPPTLVLESDLPADSYEWLECVVLDSKTLLFLKYNCVQVFLVDIINKCINLKHEIPLDEQDLDTPNFVTKQLTSGNESVIFGVRVCESNLEIFELGKGMKIMEVQSPVMEDDAYIHHIYTSPTSDDMLVTIYFKGGRYDHYIYSLQQQMFLPGPISRSLDKHNIAINKHYVAFADLPSLKIMDYHTLEVLFENEGREKNLHPKAYKDSFIFVDLTNGQRWLKIFSLTNKTITTVLEFLPTIPCDLEIINNKFVCFNGHVNCIKSGDSEDSWKKYLNVLDESQKEVTRFLHQDHNINKACTRGFSSDCTNDPAIMYYFW